IRAALGILETPGVSTELGGNKAESVPKLPPSKPQTAGRNPAVRRLKERAAVRFTGAPIPETAGSTAKPFSTTNSGKEATA
ncbi:MAG: hypothetical protein ACKPKR_08760, partial [Microcystis panniformis]